MSDVSSDALSISITTSGVGLATRGSTITVRAHGDRSAYRALRAELLLVERKLEIKFNARVNYSTVVAEVVFADGADTAELVVPAWLTDTHRGTTVGWDYEVRLIGDRVGLDAERIEAVAIGGDVPTDTTAEGAPLLTTSRPARLGFLGAPVGSGMRDLIVMFGLAGVAALVFGLAADVIPFLVAGVVLLLIALATVPSLRLHRRINIDDIEIVLPEGPIRLGSSVAVSIRDPRSRRLEVGLIAIEYAVDSNGKHRVARTETIIDRWRSAAVDGTPTPLDIGSDEPPGFAGEEVALHWIIGVRDAGCRPKDQRLATRLAPVAVVR